MVCVSVMSNVAFPDCPRNDAVAPVATSCHQQLLQVSLLEKGDEITAVDVRLPGWVEVLQGWPCPAMSISKTSKSEVFWRLTQ